MTTTKQTTTTIAAALVLGTALLGLSTGARAIEATQDDWAVTMSSTGMDADHDGRVSKQEFLDTMARAYEMKSRQMSAEGRGLTPAQLERFLRSLYVGG